MNAFQLAISLIQTPRLFASLLFWPLVAGVLVGVGQLSFAAVYIALQDESVQDFEERISENKEQALLHDLIYGETKMAGAPKVCRWIKTKTTELPPSEDCHIQELDVVIQTKDTESFNPQQYQKLFEHSTARIHICQNCSGDITFHVDGDEVTSQAYTFRSLGLYALSESKRVQDRREYAIAAKIEHEQDKTLRGTLFFHPNGYARGIDITNLSKSMMLITNVALIVLTTVWLALRAHKRVLDYFTRNNALLPLVAATGSKTFYLSLWVISLIRVCFFLLTLSPALIYFYTHDHALHSVETLLSGSSDFILWVGALLSGMCTITLIASIADLKTRHSWASFLYKYGPMICCVAGFIIWAIALSLGGTFSTVIQHTVASLPVFGFCSLLLTPIVSYGPNVLILHTLISSALALFILHRNSQWFAAHLEEI